LSGPSLTLSLNTSHFYETSIYFFYFNYIVEFSCVEFSALNEKSRKVDKCVDSINKF